MNNYQKMQCSTIDEVAEMLAEKCGHCEDMGLMCSECMKQWLERKADNDETN